MNQKDAAPGRGNGSGAKKPLHDDDRLMDLSQACKMLTLLWLKTGARTRAQTETILGAHPEWRRT